MRQELLGITLRRINENRHDKMTYKGKEMKSHQCDMMNDMKKMTDYEIAVERRLEKYCERNGWIASALVSFGVDYVDCQLEKFGREEVLLLYAILLLDAAKHKSSYLLFFLILWF